MKLDTQPQQQQPQIDLKRDTKLILCENKLIDTVAGIERDCNGTMFAQAYELRKLSAIVSPTGQGGVVPTPTFYCLSCGREKDISDIQ